MDSAHMGEDGGVTLNDPRQTHLHHEDYGVESDHGQHCVLERRGHNKVPQSVLEGLTVLGHVAGKRFGTDGKVNTGPLRDKRSKRKTDTR